ncbi:MAG TPA: hypothetical protein VGT40_25920 [Methylomirabilota bacterium]|jgi:hypothetical protein|nr:hypothetical protein [Methylomirabilota bacterium]
MGRALALLALVLLWTASAPAAEWGSIEPGVTSTEQVRSRYGAPAKETHTKVEGYDTVQWIYEGSKAPTGLVRMTVDFGLLTSSGYKPSTVRLLKLEPKPLIFGRNTVLQGWGLPDAVGKQDGVETFFYKDGLFVLFDQEGTSATIMVFAIPQPDAPTQGTGPAAPPKR